MAKPVVEELKKFEEKFKYSIRSENKKIQAIIDHMMQSDGKKIRPILLLLAAKASGTINDVSYNSAITLELLHTASLIHDDVVDESLLRRGKPSLNAIYDNKIAVLVGDYYLSTALMTSVLTGNMEIIEIISSLGRSLAEGELNQLSLVKELILDEEEYYNVIRKKTASLLSASMRIGAISTNASEDDIEMYTKLGDILGICFQLRDDIFDYYSDEIGKPTGNDIREGKITLPLLHAIKTASEENRIEIVEIINSANYTDSNIKTLINFAIENGGIDYAYRRIDDFKDEAISIISTIEKQDIKEALLTVLDYIIKRKY